MSAGPTPRKWQPKGSANHRNYAQPPTESTAPASVSSISTPTYTNSKPNTAPIVPETAQLQASAAPLSVNLPPASSAPVSHQTTTKTLESNNTSPMKRRTQEPEEKVTQENYPEKEPFNASIRNSLNNNNKYLIQVDDDEEGEDEDVDNTVFENWNEEEIQSVLNYFEVDSLEPDSWSDHEEEYDEKEEQNKMKNKENAKPKLITLANLNPLKAPSSQMKKVIVAAEVADTTDPLGINEARYKEAKKTFEKDPKNNNKSLLITSKNFDTNQFLLAAHRQATFKDLEKGVAFLKTSIQQRSDLLKNLVKTHFAKFVSAKSTIDAFYDEMRNQNLISSEEYGIYHYTRVLELAQEDANNLYGPMLERRKQAVKIRGALSVLETWRFVFSLPNSVKINHQKKNYEAIVQDYLKGKYLMQTSFKQDGNTLQDSSPPSNQNQSPTNRPNQQTSQTADDNQNGTLPQSYQKIFNQVWNEVLSLISLVRQDLFQQLKDPEVPIETQEKIIDYLIKLDEPDNPCWFYLNHQYHFILEQINKNYEEFRLNTEYQVSVFGNGKTKDGPLLKASTIALQNGISELQFSSSNETDDFAYLGDVTELKKILNAVFGDGFGPEFDDKFEIPAWRAYEKMMDNLTNLIAVYLPGFWRVCKMFSVVYTENTNHHTSNDGGANNLSSNINQQKQQEQQQTGDVHGLHGRKKYDNDRFQICLKMMNNLFEQFNVSIGMLFFESDADKSSKYSSNWSMAPESQKETSGDGNNKKCIASKVGIPTISVDPIRSIEMLYTPNQGGSGSAINHAMTPGSVVKLTAKVEDIDCQFIVDEPMGCMRLPPQIRSLINCHPLISGFYMSRVSALMLRMVYELKNRKVSGGSMSEIVLQQLMEGLNKMKHHALEKLCERTYFTISNFYLYENWVLVPTSGSNRKFANMKTSETVQLSYRFMKFMLRALLRIAAATFNTDSKTNRDASRMGMESNQQQQGQNRQNHFALGLPTVGLSRQKSIAAAMEALLSPSVSAEYREWIQSAIFDAFAVYLDGMEWCISNWRDPSVEAAQKLNATGNQTSSPNNNRVLKNNNQSQSASQQLITQQQITHPTNQIFDNEDDEVFWKYKKKKAIGSDFFVVISSADNAQSVVGWTAAARNRGKMVDESLMDTRILITLSNLIYVQQVMLPKLRSSFETKFQLSFVEPISKLFLITDHLDRIAFNNFIRRSSQPILSLINYGILKSGMDWNDMNKLREVRPFYHEILLHLVMIHAQVSQVSKNLVNRILKCVLLRMSQALLLSFRDVDRFSVPGMLQAILEMEFLQDTLKNFSDESIEGLFDLIYQTIEKSVDQNDSIVVQAQKATKERDVHDETNEKEFDNRHGPHWFAGLLKEALKEKQMLLEEAKSATKVQLLCFKANAIQEAGEDDGAVVDPDDIDFDGETGFNVSSSFDHAAHASSGARGNSIINRNNSKRDDTFQKRNSKEKQSKVVSNPFDSDTDPPLVLEN